MADGATQAKSEQCACLYTTNARRLPPSVLDRGHWPWRQSQDLSLPVSASGLTPGHIGRSHLELK